MIDLSLNEAEMLATKAARGAGFSWGLADEIGRAARFLAARSESWGEALLALAGAAQTFEAPAVERVALWRQGAPDATGPRPLCPVRTATFLLDDAANIGAPLRISNVALPIWLAAMLMRCGGWIVEVNKPFDECEVTIRRGETVEHTPGVRRAAIAPRTLAALNGYAARTYVPESERSRKRGAGGGTVDDE